jgi:pyruvate-formate lyase-activating enzyme
MPGDGTREKSMAEMNWKRRGLEAMIEGLRRALLLRRNLMPWEITWYPTFACNLRCGYCNSIPGKKEDADLEACVNEIIRLAPASISILGGEPYIVPHFVDHLERLRKALPKMFILITTNGMVKREHLVRSMPLVDGMCFSIDGLGDFTRNQREGSDPDFILNNLRACAEERKRLKLKTDLAVNSVVTRSNALHLPEFYQYIASIDPTILNFSQAMQPFNHPNSIAGDPDLANQFLNEVAKLKGKIRLLLAGRIADESLRDQTKTEVKEDVTHRMSEQEPHTCYQEMFNSFLSPSGKLFTCRTYSGLCQCRAQMICQLQQYHLLQAAWIYAKHWGEFVIMNPTFKCIRFFGCPEWMNDIMQATSEEELPVEIFRVRGRLSDERVEASARFIQKHVNPKFQKSFLLPKQDDPLQDSKPGAAVESREDSSVSVASSKCKYV